MTIRYVGYYELHNLPYKKFDTITIPKGVLIHTTHPKFSPSFVNKKQYQVVIHHVLSGSHIHNPRVVWVGEGGYWKSCDINDVFLVRKEKQ